MDEKTDKTSDPEWLRNLPLRAEEIGFSPDQMIACKACDKPNGPNRASCLYCGARIEGASSERLDVRELEGWEKGLNVIAGGLTNSNVRTAAEKLAGFMVTDPETINTILGSGARVPVARVEFADQAAAITKMLSEFGAECVTIPDEDMLLSGAPIRLRAIDFNGDSILLTPFGGGDPTVLPREDLSLIVSCTVFKERREAVERTKRRSTTTVSETQLSTDEPILDLYTRRDPVGWRIPISGFDFSSLGADKSLLALENMSKLLSRLCNFSPDARMVDDYVSVRSLLEYCWPSEHRKDKSGPKSFGFPRKNLSSVFSSDNLLQVTKYSRLQWYLL